MARIVYSIPVLIDQSEDDDLSAEVDLNGAKIIGIMMSAAWTAATIGMQAAEASGSTFGVVTDSDGTAVVISAAAGIFIAFTAIEKALVDCARFIKISTSAGQAADRQLFLIVEHQDLH